MSINNPVGKQYLRCTKWLDNKSCAGCGKIITSELEAVVYQQMVKKLASYKTLTGRKKAAKANPKIAALQVELAHVDSEIEKLVVNPDEAANIRLMFEMYAQPTTSYGDITRYFAEQGILFNGKELIRPTLCLLYTSYQLLSVYFFCCPCGAWFCGFPAG